MSYMTTKKHKVDKAEKLRSYDVQMMNRRTVERLRELKSEHSLTDSEFMDACGPDGKPGPAHTTFVAWRTGKSVPGGDYLRRISLRFGVTTDWLLGFENAPKHHNGERATSEWYNDLSGYLQRQIGVKLRRNLSPKEVRELNVDIDSILEGFVEHLAIKNSIEWTCQSALNSARAAMTIKGIPNSQIERSLRPIHRLVEVANKYVGGKPLVTMKRGKALKSAKSEIPR